MAVHNLDKILKPKGIAVIGAINEPDHVSHRVLQNLLEAGETVFVRPRSVRVFMPDVDYAI